MGQLHQLLAVEPDLKARAQSELAQLSEKFADAGNFLGQTRVYEPLEDGGEPLPSERKELPGKVYEDLASLMLVYGEWLNAATQKEVTNMKTSADVEIDGKVIISGLPAPALLNLEGKLAELKTVLKHIPTNDIAERWEYDEAQGCYVSDAKVSYRTKKVKKTQVAYEATKEHPAQVMAFDEDVREGTWTTTVYSGQITPTDKRDMLDRLDKLIRAVKQARQHANNAEVAEVQTMPLLRYVLSG